MPSALKAVKTQVNFVRCGAEKAKLRKLKSATDARVQRASCNVKSMKWLRKIPAARARKGSQQRLSLHYEIGV
jgi:hypothetical protein